MKVSHGTPGYNCVISAKNYGTRKFRVTQIGHGIGFAFDTDNARSHRVLYMKRRFSGSFGMTIVCPSWESYNETSTWFEEYGRRIQRPTNPVGPMRIMVPNRDFDKTAIPVSGISFGDRVPAMTYALAIQFMGSRDPVDFQSSDVSRFKLPGKKALEYDPSIPYFYPAGIQLKGDMAGEDSLYDLPNYLPTDTSADVRENPNAVT